MSPRFGGIIAPAGGYAIVSVCDGSAVAAANKPGADGFAVPVTVWVTNTSNVSESATPSAVATTMPGPAIVPVGTSSALLTPPSSAGDTSNVALAVTSVSVPSAAIRVTVTVGDAAMPSAQSIRCADRPTRSEGMPPSPPSSSPPPSFRAQPSTSTQIEARRRSMRGC